MGWYKQYSIPVLLALTIFTTLFSLFSGVVGASPAPGGRSPIPGHMIPSLSGKTPTGAPDGQQVLHLTISLKLADSAGLQALINAQNDSHSPLYHHYLTPQQFTTRFAPSQASVDAVVSFLRSQGLRVQSVAANHLSIHAEGTVATVEQAFNVHISNYLLHGRVVYAPGSEPSVPSSLARLILNIGGLDNTSTPLRLSSLAPKGHHALPPQVQATGPGGGYTPSELRTAYDMNPLISTANGVGQTVALAELDGYIPSDVNTYLNFYSLGAAKYSNVLLDGATGVPTTNGGGAIEVELDMEVVSAIAPGAAQKIYIAPNTFQGFLDVFNQIVVDDTAQVTSNSWGLCESLTGTSAIQAFDNVFSVGAAQGQAFFSASGDAGSADCQGADPTNTNLSVDYPASDPFVVGVGGTSLTTGSGGSYSGETVWNNIYGSDGGGLSSFFTQPSYQTGPGVTNSFSNGMREVPDVSADADPTTGYSEYCTDYLSCNRVGWIEVGGTSAAAPLWAGIAADINQYLTNQGKSTLGSASAALYQVFNTPQALSAFHDITSGNNDNNGLNNGKYQATTGYDLASGIGTPDVWNLAQNLAGASLVVTPTFLELTTIPGMNPVPQTITIRNDGSNSLNWSLAALPAWLSATPASGTIPAQSSGQFTLSFTIGSTPQTYSTNLVVQDSKGIFQRVVPVTVVAATVSKTWYFAEGYTGSGFSEYLTIANPNSTATMVTVQYLLQNASPLTKQYLVNANSRFTLNVNNEIGPNQNVSLVVTADQPIIAERPMYFSFLSGVWKITIPGGSDVLGATSPGTDFDFGYLDTTTNHDTYLTILNQNGSIMDVSISYFAAAGGSPTVIHHMVGANSRGTIHVNDEGMSRGTYSALVHLSLPGLVERPMYLKDGITGNTGAADVVGVTQPLTDWYFAEGFIDPTFSERYIVSNPGTTIANVTLTFFLASGAPQTTSFSLAPGQQTIFNASSLVSSNNSAHVYADHPILAERFISFKFGNSIPGATDVLGTGTPSNLFYFAEGFTGSGFSEYLTIENPNTTDAATAQVTFLPDSGGAPVVRVYTIAPSSRFTLNTSSVMPGQSFSMIVESNVSLVAERPMYFNFPGGRTGGSDVVGYQPPGSTLPPPPLPPTTLYIGTTTTSASSNFMYGLNPATGALVWRYHTAEGNSTAAFANGVLYFGSFDNYFYAVNATNGTLLWRTQIGAMTFPASAVVNGVVYLVSSNKTIYALNAANGAIIWSHPIAAVNPFVAAPTVANGMVYVGVDGQGLTALNASDGSVRWTYAAPGLSETTPAVDNGMVYFFSSADSSIHALNATTGASVWAYNNVGSSGAAESVVAANGVVYIADMSAGTYAINGTTGAALWHTPVPSPYINSHAPAVANGIVYVGVDDVTAGNSGGLYAYDANTGNLLWHYQAGNRVDSTAAVANGIVYFGSYDGYIYALNASTGALVWRYQTGTLLIDTPTIAP